MKNPPEIYVEVMENEKKKYAYIALKEASFLEPNYPFYNHLALVFSHQYLIVIAWYFPYSSFFSPFYKEGCKCFQSMDKLI